MRFFVLLFLMLSACLAVVAYGYSYMTTQPLTGPLPVTLTVSPGDNIQTVVEKIEKAGVKLPQPIFTWWARFTGEALQIKPGVYTLDDTMTPLTLLKYLVKGKVEMSRLLVVEGWTFQQMRQQMNDHPDLVSETIAWNDQQILETIGAREKHPEGLFFPDTYLFSKGTTDIEIFKLAYDTMQSKLSAGWEARDPTVPYKTPYEALIMASIIEKESGHPEDRGEVGGVFVNRLKRKMRLQSDPTVIYGMGDLYHTIKTIRKVDLTTDTPYNTYTRAGLPPTPIALPGMASLQAALRPTPTKSLYFVAKGDGSGSSQFSENLSDHNAAVRDYRARTRRNATR